MTVTIREGTAAGRMHAPASKSMAHRALICGALSKNSTIERVDFSEDIKATLECLAALGAKVEISGNSVTLGGLCSSPAVTDKELFCNESGSTLRFMIPLCLVKDNTVSLCGSARLFERPLGIYEEICRAQGIKFIQSKNGLQLSGQLKSGNYEVRGDISSQFISGLLFALPLLGGDSVLNITGNLESLSYIKLTLKALGDFGVRVSRTDETTLYIPGNQSYKSRTIAVEGDYSNSAFFEALNLFGGNVLVEDLNPKSLQGDRIYRKLFKTLPTAKNAIDLTDCPDLAPILFAVAAAKGGAVFTGTRRLQIKESDRAAAMAEELAKFGIPVRVTENSVTVGNAPLQPPKVLLDGHNDHRIVMALSVLCTLTGGTIAGAQAVSKSFPDFFDRLSAVGIKVDYQ